MSWVGHFSTTRAYFWKPHEKMYEKAVQELSALSGVSSSFVFCTKPPAIQEDDWIFVQLLPFKPNVWVSNI